MLGRRYICTQSTECCNSYSNIFLHSFHVLRWYLIGHCQLHSVLFPVSLPFGHSSIILVLSGCRTSHSEPGFCCVFPAGPSNCFPTSSPSSELFSGLPLPSQIVTSCLFNHWCDLSLHNCRFSGGNLRYSITTDPSHRLTPVSDRMVR